MNNHWKDMGNQTTLLIKPIKSSNSWISKHITNNFIIFLDKVGKSVYPSILTWPQVRQPFCSIIWIDFTSNLTQKRSFWRLLHS